MSEHTSIEWCDSTFNPWIGCTRVSPACDDCYAARSTPARTMQIAWGPGQPRRRTAPATWKQPLLWNREHEAFMLMHGRRRRVFCASLADVFDNEVDPAWRADLFQLIADTPNLDWLLLTKRIGNVAKMLGDHPTLPLLPNIWLGITVVNQAEADRDIPKLLAGPARVRFLSIEPMLGPIDLRKHLGGTLWVGGQRGCGGTHRHSGDPRGHDHGGSSAWVVGDPRIKHHHHDNRCRRGIDWVICGGESGPKARPMHPDWARSLRDQCEAAGVPFLFKQWGEWVPADGHSEGHIVPVSEICGDIPYTEGKRVRTQWLSPNGGIVGHSFAMVGKKAACRLLDGREHNGFPGGAA